MPISSRSDITPEILYEIADNLDRGIHIYDIDNGDIIPINKCRKYYKDEYMLCSNGDGLMTIIYFLGFTTGRNACHGQTIVFLNDVLTSPRDRNIYLQIAADQSSKSVLKPYEKRIKSLIQLPYEFQCTEIKKILKEIKIDTAKDIRSIAEKLKHTSVDELFKIVYENSWSNE